MDQTEAKQQRSQKTDVVVCDLVWGVDEIANVIGRTRSATWHLLSKGLLPAKKVGKNYVASRSGLIADLTQPAARVTKKRRDFV